MKNYSLFYSYRGIGDVLIIIFDNELKPTSSKTRGSVTVIYHDDEIIGYNIVNIKEIIKIRSEGKIYLPSPALIKVINSILINAKLPPLEEQKDSGYFTALVSEINDKYIEVSFDNEKLHAAKYENAKKGDKVVITKSGTLLANGQTFKEKFVDGVNINAHICTNIELGIDDEETILKLDEDVEIGKDFFSMEEK